MENYLHLTLLVCVLLFHIVISSVEDCWDDTKLSRMKFPTKPGKRHFQFDFTLQNASTNQFQASKMTLDSPSFPA